jgi:hypothetical protein
MVKDLSLLQKHRMDLVLSLDESLHQQLNESKEGSAPLRFNQNYIKASVIAEQYYCEKKTEMTQIHGRVETETKKQGSEGHESLLWNTVEAEREEILQKIFSEESLTVHEMPLLAKYRDVILAGQPDAIMFKEGNPVALFEYKFSKSPLPYRSYHVQARVYGRILEGMGFDTTDLFYIIAVVPKESRSDTEIFRRVIEAVKENGAFEVSLKVKDSYVYLYEYNKGEAEKDIDWALEYWKCSRDAYPADNPNKCRSCEYKEKCLT